MLLLGYMGEYRLRVCTESFKHSRMFITPFVGDQFLLCDAFGFEILKGCRPTNTSKKSSKGKLGRPPKPQVENS